MRRTPEEGLDSAGVRRPPRRLVREPELSELRAFVTAAMLGSIAEAARSLNVTQPALSKRLRTLEAVAGASLFERSARGVTLTEAGAHLFAAAKRVLLSADNVKAILQHPVGSGPVRLAASPAIAELRLPAVLAQLAELETGLSVELMSVNSPAVRELLREERCDVGIAAIGPFELPETFSERVLWRDEVVIAVPPGHPWSRLEEVPVDEFARTPVVQRDPWSNAVRTVVSALELAGLERAPPLASLGSTSAIIELALATGAPALLSLLAVRQFAESRLLVRRVEGLRFDREYAVIWCGPLDELPPRTQAVVQHLLDLPFARSRRAVRRLGRDHGIQARSGDGEFPAATPR